MVTLGLHQAVATRPTPAAARWVGLLACAACASGAAAAAAPAQQETFRWHGELVALEEGTRELTVRARLTSPAALAEMPAVEAGESILITWAGFENRAHGIRAVTRDDGAELEDEAGRFVVRAEFVSVDPATRYLTFKAAISKSSATAVRTLTRGDWATVTSPHSPSDAAVAAVGAYGARSHLHADAEGAYLWNGELLALDENAQLLTVRSRVTAPDGLAAVAGAPAGAPIVITWSGYDDRANGIRAVVPEDGSGLWGNDGFLLRAELVAADPDARYLTFKAPIPDGSVATVRTLTRGDWATVTSPHWPADGSIAAVAAYDAKRPSINAAAEGTYRWHGELLALDDSAEMLTVRARVAAPEGLAPVSGAEPGAPIVITWSGFEDRAGAIRAVTPDNGSGLWGNDRFLLRGEFVAAHPAGRYLTFKAPIPRESIPAVRTLTRGDWATVTSPHWPTEGAVASVAAYDATRPALRAAAEGTYRWHGELVALDESTRTLTVRARVAAAAGMTAVTGAQSGDPIVITWSGFEDRASGIRAVTPEDGSGLWGSDGFLLQARFVAADPASQSLTFEAEIPEPSVGAVRTLTRGDWATVTSPHWPTEGAVADVVAYDAGQTSPRAAAEGIYRWNGELVALDESTRTLTIRARVAAADGLTAVTGAQTGDPDCHHLVRVRGSGERHPDRRPRGRLRTLGQRRLPAAGRVRSGRPGEQLPHVQGRDSRGERRRRAHADTRRVGHRHFAALAHRRRGSRCCCRCLRSFAAGAALRLAGRAGLAPPVRIGGDGVGSRRAACVPVCRPLQCGRRRRADLGARRERPRHGGPLPGAPGRGPGAGSRLRATGRVRRGRREPPAHHLQDEAAGGARRRGLATAGAIRIMVTSPFEQTGESASILSVE